MINKSYWKIEATGQVFQNRKEAKEALGHYYFNKLCKEGKISFYVSEKNIK